MKFAYYWNCLHCEYTENGDDKLVTNVAWFVMGFCDATYVSEETGETKHYKTTRQGSVDLPPPSGLIIPWNSLNEEILESYVFPILGEEFLDNLKAEMEAELITMSEQNVSLDQA